MVFRNIVNNQVAHIENEKLVAQYRQNKDWVQADEKFIAELEEEKKLFNLKQIEYSKMANIKSQLILLSEDIVQDAAGVEVLNIAEKKQAFFKLLNELRALENKEPKTLKQKI